MPNFCGKCGSPLDPATGICLNCNPQQAQTPQTSYGAAPVNAEDGQLPYQNEYQPEQSFYYDAPENGYAAPVYDPYESQQEPQEPKKKNGVLIAVLITLIVLVAAAGALVALQMTKVVDIPFLSFLNQNEDEESEDDDSTRKSKRDVEAVDATAENGSVEVPDFTGMDIDRIRNDETLTDVFDFVIVEEFSETVAENCVISQDVQPGTKVKSGAQIVLRVSSGEKTVSVPDLSGYTYEDAAALLTDLGLTSRQELKKNPGSNTPGTVAETVPAAGSTVNRGDVITVRVWSKEQEEETAEASPSGEQVRLEDDMRLRSGPGMNYSYSRVLPTGTGAILLSIQGEWANISVNGVTGWVHGPTAFPSWWSGGAPAPAGPAESYPYTAVLKNTMKLRSGPSTQYSVKTTISVGSTVTVQYKQTNSAGELWAYISYGSYEGWVRVKEAGV